MFKRSDVLNEELRGSSWLAAEAAKRTIWACELPLNLPSNKLQSAISCIQGDLILTYIAVISCSPVNKWSYESLCGEGASAWIFGFQWPQGSLGLAAALKSGVPFISARLFCIAKSSFCSPSCQLEFVWMWNKLGVLKCWVSCSAVAQNSSAVKPAPEQRGCFRELQCCVAPLGCLYHSLLYKNAGFLYFSYICSSLAIGTK